jgi:hypothetical protein
MSDTTTPRALRLADWIGDQWMNYTLGRITQAEVSEVMQELRDQHELIQRLKAALEGCIDEAEEAVTNHVLSYGEHYKTARLAALRKQVSDAREALAAAEAKA